MAHSMSVSRVAGGRISALSLPIAAGAIFGVALVCLIAPIRWDDQSFYTYVAPRLLDGYRLYGADVQDTNPPLISWLNLLPALLARGTGANLHASFVAFVAALAVGASAWSLRLAYDRRSPQAAAWLGVVLVYATVILPSVAWKLRELGAFGMGLRYDFGQREHFLALLALPYLFLATRRLAGRPLGQIEAVTIGAVAALGFCLKPQYLTVVAAVEAVMVAYSRSLRPLFRPELVALIVTGLAYCAVVWIVTPEYFSVIPMVAAVYGDFGRETPWQIMLLSKYNVAVVAAALLGLVLLRGAGPMQRGAAVLLAAGVAALASFFLQSKGWTDHLLPAETFIVLSLGLTLIGRAARPTHAGRPAFSATGVVLAAASCVAALTFYYPARAALWAESEYAHLIAETNAATAADSPGTGFLMLGDGIYSQFDIAMQRGFNWASRWPFMILPEATIRAESSGAGHADYLMVSDALAVTGRRVPDAREYAAMLRRDTVEDFERWKPAVVLVQRCDDPVIEPCLFGAGFRIDEWLARDPAFAAIWSRYAYDRHIWRFDLYRLRVSDALQQPRSSAP